MQFRFCPLCATPLERCRRGDRDRPACPQCGYVQYRNPTVGVAVIVRRADGALLLGRRGPAAGYGAGQWCVPCGHVEWDEDVRAAAVREFAEETGLHVHLTALAAVESNFHDPRQHTVGIWFHGAIAGGDPMPGDDLVDLAWFARHALPDLAFVTDRRVIEGLGEP